MKFPGLNNSSFVSHFGLSVRVSYPGMDRWHSGESSITKYSNNEGRDESPNQIGHWDLALG